MSRCLAVFIVFFTLAGLRPLAAAVPAPADLQARAESLRRGEGLLFPYQAPLSFAVLADRQKAFAALGAAAVPRPLQLDGKTVKYLVPFDLGSGHVGAFVQFDPTGRLIALPDFTPDGRPSFVVSATEWANCRQAGELAALAELVPDKTSYSAGAPFDPAWMKGAWFVRDGYGRLPGKSQEERLAWIRTALPAAWDGQVLGTYRGRRTGTSK